MDLNRLVAYSLRAGVLFGAFLSLAGISLWALRGFDTATANPSTDVAGSMGSVFSGNVTGLVYLGVVILIATPVFRVVVSVLYFGFQKDKRYVGLTLLVLAMLILALVSGAAA